MPKDAKKNVDRYKIRGGDLNEFEFHKNQARVKESLPGNRNAANPFNNPMNAASQSAVNPVSKKAAKPSSKNAAKRGSKKAGKSVKGATAKKLAAKKAAKK